MSKAVRYDRNPFIENMVVPIKGQAVRLSKLGKDDNILVNQATGEVQGTHVTTYRRVDAEQFVKLFTANIALTFDLKAAGIKAFNVLLWCLQNRAVERDLIPLDKIVLDEFLAEHSERKPPIKLSQPTFWRGLAELEKAQIIAKHLRQGWYYINPNFAFNGDRIAFTTVIERKPKPEAKGDGHLQQSLPIADEAEV
ncbi:replication/maintenance protein RepL (plasmid) [Halomonas sp. M1]|uniref:replication/maintenance protein RepL n=1 Tax=Halomonas sp. M1 TaxID=3035470 RepID=UPI0024858EC8|nr:replication/maintenance protein RepL [Halomonas sp. M1]WFE73184.1 replication/maintenance protein RepL [Halomonas sp. M1]